MQPLIDKPQKFQKDLLEQMILLIEAREQVTRANTEYGIEHADLITMLIDDGVIVTAATFKNPRLSYRDSVFQAAGVGDQKHSFVKELGYIVTNPKYEGKKCCQKLLTEFMPIIMHENIFATTRKPSMAHILGKYGFTKTGSTYKEDLSLLVLKRNNQISLK